MTKMLWLSLLALALVCSRTYGFVELNEFMPYGPDHGDADLGKGDHIGNLDDGSSPPVKLEEPFQFFKYHHSVLWVNINGAISFNKAIEKYTPTCEAQNNDMSMISPFWADVDIRYHGSVYYRYTTDKVVLDKAHEDVNKAFPDIGRTDTMRWAVVATWLDVPFYDDVACHNSNLTNTFQLTLVTDGLYHFAIFYYNKIQWTTGTASDSDGCTGRGGKPARAGFDNGEGMMAVLPGSCSEDILQVPSRSIGLTPGKYVFRVDDNSIIAPGSTTLGVITNTNEVTETPTHSPGETTTQKKLDFEDHLNNTRHHLGDLVGIAAQLCPGLIEHPALQDECFEAWKKLDNLIDELKFTKTEDELGQIDREASWIAMIFKQIQEDIAALFR